ncbi:MAG: hypothetical protein ACLFSZ_06695 [Puniceicoccaceae bacterium]
MFRFILCLFSAVFLAGCQSLTSPSFSGAWETPADADTAPARLVVFRDNTFHVDVPAKEGIEVEGHLLFEGKQVTFVNDRGTDAAASDPTPGTYVYSVDGDELVFEKIQDPLERRSRFLDQTWTRVK